MIGVRRVRDMDGGDLGGLRCHLPGGEGGLTEAGPRQGPEAGEHTMSTVQSWTERVGLECTRGWCVLGREDWGKMCGMRKAERKV